MTDRSDPEGAESAHPLEAVPDGLAPGSTVLVASVGDPTESEQCFQVLSRLAAPEDTALVVTTTESAETTIENIESVFDTETRPSFSVVDTESRQQSISADYRGVPTVFTPSPGDLERMVVALRQLSGADPPATGDRHLVVRSLTPIIEHVPIDQLCTVLDQIAGIRTSRGLTLFGVDEIAHDDETIRALTGCVDGVLWVTVAAGGTLEVTYRPVGGRFSADPESTE